MAGLVLVAALPGVAAAQMPSASRNGFHPQFQPKDTDTRREPAPPALPGAQTAPGQTSARGEPLDLPPTEALFDAINRGDMNEARDALARGADVQGENVLGMTPIALSVDLGRNDITFLLLSYRSGGGAAPVPPGATTASAPPSSGKSPRPPARSPAIAAGTNAAAASPASIRTRTHSQATSRASNPVHSDPTATASATPGVPVPQAGFLGFGGSAQN